jgi:hypothetical protein
MSSAQARLPCAFDVDSLSMECDSGKGFALFCLPPELVLEVLGRVRWSGCVRDWVSLWYVSLTMRTFVKTALEEAVSVGDLGWSRSCGAPLPRDLNFVVAVRPGRCCYCCSFAVSAHCLTRDSVSETRGFNVVAGLQAPSTALSVLYSREPAQRAAVWSQTL